MTDEEVLREVREARDAFAKSHGYDIGKMAADLRAMDLADDRLVVRCPPRRPTPEAQAAAKRYLDNKTNADQIETLKTLAEVWALSPHVNLGQLMTHLDKMGKSFIGKALGSIENTELVAVLNRYQGELKGRPSASPELVQEGFS